MSQLIFSTWFSGGRNPVGPADAVTQVVRVDNQFSCECVVEIESNLVIDEQGTPVDSKTLAYNGTHVSFRQTERVAEYPRKKSRRKKAGQSVPLPNPLDLEHPVVVGCPPAGEARPYQVFGEVVARATVSINGKPRKNALWEEGFEARDSVVVA